MMKPDIVYIDIRTSDLTLSQVIAAMTELREKHPDQEIFLDGDAYAIIGRPRRRGSGCRPGIPVKEERHLKSH